MIHKYSFTSGDIMEQKKLIFALGFFDGVHRGHQVLLRHCVELAEQNGCEAAALTFDRHPKSMYMKVPRLISTEKDRDFLLRHYGIKHVYCYPVNEKSMSLNWKAFLDELVTMGAAGFVCGDDFRFGYKGIGDGKRLKVFCEARNMPCFIVQEQADDGIRISSTYIRKQIAEGDMATAVKFLGHPYVLTGKVVEGRQLGRRLGIPTANIQFPPGIIVPKFGVYACRVRVDEGIYVAVTNVGTRPTVNGKGITVEPWILDFSGDLYGKEITVEFHYFLRPEKKFYSLEELKEAIHLDEARTWEMMKETPIF